MKGIPCAEPVEANEVLSRFILFSRWLRADGTVKQDAFIPFPYPDLSVIRQKCLTGIDLWQIGNDIAIMRNKPLYGRADLTANVLFELSSPLRPDPTPPPPINHVNITGWPSDKAEQKVLALQIAAKATFFKN
jgi:hypothetical protein